MVLREYQGLRLRVRATARVVWTSLSVCALAAAVLVLVAALGVEAEIEKIDKIVATVGDLPVTYRELERQVVFARGMLEQQGMGDIPLGQLREQVLQDLIVRKLQLVDAARLGIGVTDEEIDASIARVAEKNGIGVEQLRMKIEEQIGSYALYRRQMGEDLITAKLLQREVINKMEVDQGDVEKHMAEMGGDLQLKFLYLSADLPENLNLRENLLRKLSKLRRKIKDSRDFVDLAERWQSKIGYEIASTRWMEFDELPRSLRTHIFSQTEGGIFPLIVTPKKAYLFYLSDSSDLGIDVPSEEKFLVRHILYHPVVLESDATARKRLRWMKLKIMEGRKFGDTAKRFSQDPGSNFKGGALGWVSLDSLDPDFAQAVASAKIGEIVGPVKSAFGWHLIHVMGRKQDNPVMSTLKKNAIIHHKQAALEEERRKWLLHLRGKYHIEILNTSP